VYAAILNLTLFRLKADETLCAPFQAAGLSGSNSIKMRMAGVYDVSRAVIEDSEAEMRRVLAQQL
jgi:hypothetical protein